MILFDAHQFQDLNYIQKAMENASAVSASMTNGQQADKMFVQEDPT